MAIAFCVVCLLCLCGIRVNLTKEGNQNYLSIDQTLAVKGFFIIIVFLSHFHSYVTFTNQWDILCADIVGGFGQAMVAMFLFYSGYGVMESIRNRGTDYVAAMPRKRILETLLRFDCAVLLYVPAAVLTREKITVSRFLLSLIGWDSLGNSNWYIFVILFLYGITFVAFSVLGADRPWRGILTVFLGTSALVFAAAFWNIKPMWWYDTALCYVLGMAWSQGKFSQAAVYIKKFLPYTFLLIGLLAALCVLRHMEYNAVNQIMHSLVFALVVVLITMRVSNRSRVLKWCGKHLFALYILQRIPMIVLKYIGLNTYSASLYLLCCAVGTAILVYPFEFVTGQLCGRIPKKRI